MLDDVLIKESLETILKYVEGNAQMPDIVKEIITIGSVQYGIVFFVLTIISGIMLNILFYLWFRGSVAENGDLMLMVPVVVSTSIVIVMWGYCLRILFMIYFSPRLYVIDYLRNIM